MGNSFSPPGLSSRGTVFVEGVTERERKGTSILGQTNNQFRRAEPNRPTAAQFARLSSSMQLTLLLIRRAQQSSRRTIERAANMGPQIDAKE